MYKFGERIKIKPNVKKQNTDFSGSIGDFLYQPNAKEAEVELISANNSRFRTRFKLTEIEKNVDKPAQNQAPKASIEVFCDYCGEQAHLVTGKQLYPHRPDLAGIKAWQCTPCDASVGCHKNSENPLGRLANKALKKMKMKAHAAFDPLWKSGEMSRTEAYEWLQDKLNLDPDACHIGKFDETMCQKVIDVIAKEG